METDTQTTDAQIVQVSPKVDEILAIAQRVREQQPANFELVFKAIIASLYGASAD